MFLITGSKGYIGSHLCSTLGGDFKGLVRPGFSGKLEPPYVESDLFSISPNANIFTNIESIIHLAGIAHGKFNEADYQKFNTEMTLTFANNAAMAGVKRFVFVSSIGVNGLTSNSGPFRHTSKENPHNAYTQSKYNAEVGLQKIAQKTGLEVVIVRPTLVYGVNAPGNFALLMGLVKKLPCLPFGLVANRRTFIAVQNLVDLLVTCAKHPSATGHVFLAADNDVVTIKEFTNAIANSMGKSLIQLPIPVSLMRFSAKLIGKSAIAEQLLENLEVDSTNAQQILGWTPPYTMEEAMIELSRGS